MNKLKKKLITKFSLAVVVLTMTFSAWAITLEQAKQQGLVGEMSNGFLGVVVTNTEVASLVDSVNKKRKTIYLDLARKNNLTMQQVTVLAGKKAIKKTSSGHLIKNSSGKWVKK
ncbi:MAG: YdbL family protein [Colwellia sp.]|nr:YdbL family protein [Colwellia sp.]